MSIIVVYTWPENYGNQSANIQESMTNALRAIKDGTCLILLFSSELQVYSGSSKTNITDLCMFLWSQSFHQAPDISVYLGLLVKWTKKWVWKLNFYDDCLLRLHPYACACSHTHTLVCFLTSKWLDVTKYFRVCVFSPSPLAELQLNFPWSVSTRPSRVYCQQFHISFLLLKLLPTVLYKKIRMLVGGGEKHVFLKTSSSFVSILFVDCFYRLQDTVSGYDTVVVWRLHVCVRVRVDPSVNPLGPCREHTT